MSNIAIKILILTFINIILWGYVIFMFHESEPKYANDRYGKPIVGDFVTVLDNDRYRDLDDRNYNGLVVQTDSTTFSIRFNSDVGDFRNSGIITFPYEGTDYKIIGTGTFYHRVNSYVGFNIMFITIIIVIVTGGVVFVSEVLLIRSLIF